MLDRVKWFHFILQFFWVAGVGTGRGVQTWSWSGVLFAYIASYFMFAAELFSDVQPMVQSALDGYNISLFAYGQTHSGKTHTMVVLSVFRSVC